MDIRDDETLEDLGIDEDRIKDPSYLFDLVGEMI